MTRRFKVEMAISEWADLLCEAIRDLETQSPEVPTINFIATSDEGDPVAFCVTVSTIHFIDRFVIGYMDGDKEVTTVNIHVTDDEDIIAVIA